MYASWNRNTSERRKGLKTITDGVCEKFPRKFSKASLRNESRGQFFRSDQLTTIAVDGNRGIRTSSNLACQCGLREYETNTRGPLRHQAAQTARWMSADQRPMANRAVTISGEKITTRIGRTI